MNLNLRNLALSGCVVILFVAFGCEQPRSPRPSASTSDKQPDSATDSTTATSDAVTPEQKTDQPLAKSGNKVLLGSPELTAGIPGSGPLRLDEINKWLDDPKNHETLDIELPLGLSAGIAEVKGLEQNPLTRAKIELGRQLYFDSRVSADNTVSCASCHAPEEGFAKHTQFGVGISGKTGGRNSPTSYNRILSDAQFWDGRAPSLEEQAKGPIANMIEMGNTHEKCIECIKGIPGYQAQFAKIFGETTIDSVAKAIAAFERTIVTGPSPFDYYEKFKPMESLDPDDLKSDNPEALAKYEAALADVKAHPMSDSAKRGREIFFGEKGNCTACHVGANLTDEKFHNLGVGMDKEKPDLGREEFTKDEKDRGAFKTPTIRNVAQTAPYMHDGSQKTLAEVVEWYDKGGHPNPHLDPKIKKLNLTPEDKADLVAFMEACTGELPKVESGRLPE